MKHSPMSVEKQKGTTPSRTFRLAVIGLLAALVGSVFCVLAWLVFNQTIFLAAPAREATAPGLLSARQAFERAQPAARDWQGDAVLARVAANWHTARLDDLVGGASAWDFTFYSPGAGEQRSIVITSTATWPVAPTRPHALLPAIDLDRWQVDSRQAMESFLGGGGREFVAAWQPVDFFLILGAEEDGRLRWTAMALKPTDSKSYDVLIDATTGKVK